MRHRGESRLHFFAEEYSRLHSTRAGEGHLHASLLPDSVPIVIDASHRSRGYGTQVLHLLIARARELGWRELRIRSIDPENVRSLRLYARAGFADGVLQL